MINRWIKIYLVQWIFFSSAMFRDSSLIIEPGGWRVCDQKEPFAVLTSVNSMSVDISMYGYYTGLKARYFVMNHTGSDGKLTLERP